MAPGEYNDRIRKRSADSLSEDDGDVDDEVVGNAAWDALVKRYGKQGGNGSTNTVQSFRTVTFLMVDLGPRLLNTNRRLRHQPQKVKPKI